MNRLLLLVSILLFAVGCSNKENTLKVIATPKPHAEMLEFIKPELEKDGVDLEIITVEDYQIPNRAVISSDADANFFQHQLFLENQIKQFGFPLEVAALIHIEPMGIYSKKIHAIKELQDGAKIALPHDPANLERALKMLAAVDLIELNQKKPITLLSITSNPKELTFYEVDAAMLSRSLDDVSMAIIPTNFALQAGLHPLTDALFLETSNPLYTNVLVVRKGDKERIDIQKLIKALKSKEIQKFVKERYQGAVIIVEE